MMNRRVALVIFVFALSRSSTGAVAPPLKELGQPWDGSVAEVRWSFNLSNLPSSATVYQVVSASYSKITLSNLLVLANLTEQDRTASPWDTPGSPAMFFHNVEQKRSLYIQPAQGYIVIENSGARSRALGPAVDVPDDAEATTLALEILSKLGVDSRQLARKPDSQELDIIRNVESRSHIDMEKNKVLKEVIARGMTFFRALDGIAVLSLRGAGRIDFQFGSRRQLLEAYLSWRSVEAKSRYPVATKDQFLDRLRNRECRCTSSPSEPVEIVTIRRISPRYLEGMAWEAQQEIHPIAEIEAEAVSRTQTNTISLFCPLLVYPK